MWKKLESVVIFKHPRITLIEDTVQLPSGQKTEYLRYAETNHAVMAICLSDGKVLIEKEYSYPTKQILYQFPGGKIEKGETPKNAIVRELAEEVGVEAANSKLLGWYYVDNRRSARKMYVFLMTDVSNTTKLKGDDEEDISFDWVEVSRIDSLIKTGEIVTYSALAGWALFKTNKNPES